MRRTVIRNLLPNGFVLAGAVVPGPGVRVQGGNVVAPHTGPGVLRARAASPPRLPRLTPHRLPWPPAPPIDRGGRY